MGPRVRHTLTAALAAALLAGCGSSVGLNPPAAKHSSGMNMSGGSGMAGMNMAGGGVAAEAPTVNGIKPVASQILATSYWQGMKIQARTMTPTTFIVFDGQHEETFKATKRTSFHLMVMLSDRHTNEPIPYAGVWATILSHTGKVVYDERQWPMISRYMGPHYGNNVTLPGAGGYTLKLLISPPTEARHLEYAHVWLKPHKVTEHFSWKPST